HFSVCDMATHFISGQVASAVKGDADALYKEFASNLIPNSHLVAAGVVAVNRAQEYGYTLFTASRLAGLPGHVLKVSRKVLLGVSQDVDDGLAVRQRKRRPVARVPLLS